MRKMKRNLIFYTGFLVVMYTISIPILGWRLFGENLFAIHGTLAGPIGFYFIKSKVLCMFGGITFVFILLLGSVSSNTFLRISSWVIAVISWVLIGFLNMLSIYEPLWGGKIGCF